jgi:hypothetical protein
MSSLRAKLRWQRRGSSSLSKAYRPERKI